MRNTLHQTMKGELQQLIIKYLQIHGPWAVTEHMTIFPHATCITKDGVLLGASSSFAKLCDYRKEELEGMQAFELTHSDDHKLLQKIFANNQSDSYPLRLRTKSGKTKHVLVFPFLLDVEGETYRFAEFVDLTERIEAEKRNVRLLIQSITALSYTVEKRDPYTVGHMNRTAAIAEKIAMVMGLDSKTITCLTLGAKIHDIGKVAVPSEILIKPSELDELDWEYIKRHPIIGLEIIAELELDPIIKHIVKSHHEYHDGSGYPEGLDADAISNEVSIITVADSLDAISGIRPYRRSYTFDEAIEIMQSCQNRYNPEILEVASTLVKSKDIASTEYMG